jgi:LysR family transcriptional regulator, glycine cleavage system transcriptional activator
LLHGNSQTSNIDYSGKIILSEKMQRFPSLNALRAFDCAVRHMSFQKAAEELFVTPAALSYQIRQLEEHLDLKLFDRLNRAVRLTAEGEALAPGIRDGFLAFENALRLLNRRQADNVLVVSAGPAFTAKWLAPRLYRFMLRHPEIDARISASLKLVDMQRDDIDVSIRFGRGKYEGCDSILLFDEYVTPMCSPRVANGEIPLEQPSDLAHHTLIHDDTHVGVFDLADWKNWLDAAGAPDVDPKRSGLHFNIADHALDAAVAGAGVVLGRWILAQNDLEAGRLVTPFDLKIKADFSFYAVILKNRLKDKNIRAFCAWLRDEISGNVEPAMAGPAV